MGKQPDIQVLSHPAAEWPRSNATMFFASGAASVEELLEQLSRGARVLGGTVVETTRHRDWFVVAAQVDWFVNGRHQVSEGLLFKRPEAFPELGQNCTRPEFVVAAFAEEVIVASPRWRVLAQRARPSGRVRPRTDRSDTRFQATRCFQESPCKRCRRGAEFAVMDSTRPRLCENASTS